MPTIPLREAELLSYLQGCGPVGEWVCPITRHVAEDLKIARSQFWDYIARLSDRGFIAFRRSQEIKGFEYRVLIRLERSDVVIKDNSLRTNEAKEMMRQKALARAERIRQEALTKEERQRAIQARREERERERQEARMARMRRRLQRRKVRFAGFEKLEAAQW